METLRSGASDFEYTVEKYRHGLRLGSNYLKLDMHVDTLPPKQAKLGVVRKRPCTSGIGGKRANSDLAFRTERT